jgi:hypothetical protein
MVCETGCKCFVAVRGQKQSDAAEIYMDEITRDALGVEAGRAYNFQLYRDYWKGYVFWAWNASEPAYRVPAQIAMISAALGLLGLILGAWGLWVTVHQSSH